MLVMLTSRPWLFFSRGRKTRDTSAILKTFTSKTLEKSLRVRNSRGPPAALIPALFTTAHNTEIKRYCHVNDIMLLLEV